MLQPIPIPSQPFKVVSMDFIPELPVSNGYDNVLVIVDKLTKYALFIPTTTTITKKGTAELFFHHIITQYGFLSKSFPIEILNGKGNFGKKYAARWE